MKWTAFIVYASCIASCTHTKVDTKAEAEKVMQLSKEWSKVASAGDVTKTLSYWADDAILMSGGQPTLNGKEAIKKMVEESFKIPGFKISWDPQTAVVSESGDMAYLIENSQITLRDSTGKSIVENSKAVSIWRKQADGSWKNVVDISTPEPAPAK